MYNESANPESTQKEFLFPAYLWAVVPGLLLVFWVSHNRPFLVERI